MKKILIGAAGVAAWFAILAAIVTSKAVSPAVAPQAVTEINAGSKRGSIVRLHDPETGAFFCSGVVVGNHTLLTAGHCTVGNTLFGNAPGTVIAEVRDASEEPTGIMATLAGASARADYAILEGDFTSFAVRGHDVTPFGILDNIENNARSIMACGYPYGGKLFCGAVTDRRMMGFSIAGHGYLYPGMSGGPVIDVATGKVIAVNSAVYESVVLLSPLIEIYAALHVTPE